jgi:hypothetical protein
MNTKVFKIGVLAFLLFAAISCDKNSGDSFVDTDTTPNQTETSKNLELSFSSRSTGGEYSPNHILAVWVENDKGDFIRSLKVRASERKKYLYTWKSASDGNTTDAVTGATISGPTAHKINWNLQSKDKTDVLNGDYVIQMESTDKSSKGAFASFPFIYEDSIISQSFPSEGSFNDVKIVFTETEMQP